MESKKIDFVDYMSEMRRKDFINIRNLIMYFKAIKDYFGDDVAKIVEDVSCKNVFDYYKNLDIKKEDRTIEKLISILWEPGRIPGMSEFTYKKVDNGIQMNCTKCPYADVFKMLGATEWGYRLYCATDLSLVKGFNENIGFRRSKTLMEGHDCCDHFYYLE
jgi:predicted ArsR family transcriptional regulator